MWRCLNSIVMKLLRQLECLASGFMSRFAQGSHTNSTTWFANIPCLFWFACLKGCVLLINCECIFSSVSVWCCLDHCELYCRGRHGLACRKSGIRAQPIVSPKWCEDLGISSTFWETGEILERHWELGWETCANQNTRADWRPRPRSVFGWRSQQCLFLLGWLWKHLALGSVALARLSISSQKREI